MARLVIRPFVETDLDPVISVFQRSIREIASEDYEPAQIVAWSTVDRVAWTDAEVAGFVDLGAGGYLDKLYVHPAHRRTGVARALLGTVEATVIARGLDAIHTDASLTARAFFEAHGFRVVAEETVMRNGQAFRRARMHKDGLALGSTGNRVTPRRDPDR